MYTSHWQAIWKGIGGAPTSSLELLHREYVILSEVWLSLQQGTLTHTGISVCSKLALVELFTETPVFNKAYGDEQTVYY